MPHLSDEQTPILARLSAPLADAPDEFMFMPAGRHTITAHRGEQPFKITVEVGPDAAVALNAALAEHRASGHSPFFDFDHDAEAASAWPQEFIWRETPAPGVYVRAEWSQAGRDAVVGKSYRAFSPAFHVSAFNTTPDQPARVTGAPFTMGGLVNDPAFRQISPLWAKRAETHSNDTPMTTEQLDALKASLAALENEIKTLTAKNAAEDQAAIAAKQAEAEIARLKIANAELAAKAQAQEAAIQAQRNAQAEAAIQAAIARGVFPASPAPDSDEAKEMARWKSLIEADPANAALLARLLELEKAPPPPARPMNVPALISEVDATWLKAQQRGRQGPVRHFPVHLGRHYTGRARRYQARGSTSLRLTRKHLLVSTMPLAQFGPQFQRLAHRLFRPRFHVLVSDGDKGLEHLRENLFPHCPWLLDRWHIAQAVRAFAGPDQAEFRRPMTPIWNAASEAALAALRTSPLHRQRPKEFHALFGYLLGKREGIDAWQQIPASLRHGCGRTPPAVKPGSGTVEKNIEIAINRRFKSQGRSWHPLRAQRLLPLKQLLAQPAAWNAWWKTKPQFHLKPHPSALISSN